MKFLIFFFCFFISFTAALSKNFYFTKIEICGLKTISKEYILKDIKSNNITKNSKLFKQLINFRLFEKIKISIKKETLYIFVKERPYIKHIKIYGDDKDAIQTLLGELKICNGNTYEYALLKLLKIKAKEFYDRNNLYNAKLIIKVKKHYNFVDIKINSLKGNKFKIKSIEIKGNKTFSKRKILNTFVESTSKWMLLFNRTNDYNDSVLQHDVKSLKKLYLDRGFADINVNYIKIILDKKEKAVSILINISESGKCKFGRISIRSKKISLPKKHVARIIKKHIKKNDPFVYKKLIELKKAINNFLYKTKVYGFTTDFKIVSTNAGIANVLFTCGPQKITHVKKIRFSGNFHTSDLTLRQFVKQIEDSYLSTEKINNAKQEMIKCGYAKSINIRFAKKNKKLRKADVVFEMKERKSNKMIAGLSYGKKSGLTIHINSEQINFLGSGKDISLNFTRNKYMSDHNLTIIYPNLFDLDIDVSYNFYYRKEKRRRKIVTEYSTNAYGFTVVVSYKLQKNMKLHLAFGGDRTYLRVPGFKYVPYLKKFINLHGVRYKEYFLTVVYVYSSLNKSIHPSTGLLNKLTFRITIRPSKIKYYMINYDFNYYKSLSDDFIVSALVNLAYGNKYSNTRFYPFYRHFSLKGKYNVRGYAPKTLGPRTYNRNINLGGNALISIKFHIHFPFPVLSNSKRIRTSLFLDLGQTYETRTNFSNRPFRYSKSSKHNSFLKYSCGLSISWLTPLNIPIEMSFAYPLNPTIWDKKESFLFEIGLRKH